MLAASSSTSTAPGNVLDYAKTGVVFTQTGVSMSSGLFIAPWTGFVPFSLGQYHGGQSFSHGHQSVSHPTLTPSLTNSSVPTASGDCFDGSPCDGEMAMIAAHLTAVDRTVPPVHQTEIKRSFAHLIESYINIANLQQNDQHQSQSAVESQISVTKQSLLGLVSQLTQLDHLYSQKLSTLSQDVIDKCTADYIHLFRDILCDTPSSLWTITGDLLHCNNAMINLIGHSEPSHSPLRLDQLLTLESFVLYCEKFCQISGDLNKKAVLTSATLKRLDDSCLVECSMSFTIRRYDNVPIAVAFQFMPLNV